MKNKVLISSVGRKVSLVKAFKEAGWHVTGLDKDKSAIGLQFCDEVLLGRYYPSDYLWIPTRDAEIEQVNQINGFDMPYIETCLDKFNFYGFCKQHGFKTPEVYFVKPRISKSGKETECVWQEMVEGEEYSIDAFADFEGNVISIVPRKRIKTLNGESTVSLTVSSELLLSETESLMKALHLIGHNCLQCFLVSGKVIWTDVNCRFGGASIVGIRAGCKSPEWLLKLINGEAVKPCIGDYKVGLIGKSYTEWDYGF